MVSGKGGVRVGDRAGEYGAGERPDGERRVLTLDHLALHQALLDERPAQGEA